MKILFLNAYFYPENVPFSHLEQDIIKRLVSAGHEITIICPVPTRGISFETAKKYQSVKYEEIYKQSNAKACVRRFWAPREGKNCFFRALRYFWCNFRQYQIGKKYKQSDLIFSISTPPTQGYFAGRLAAKFSCPFIYSLQDVFPDSLVTTGIAKKDSWLWMIGRRLEIATYALSEKIVVISNSIMRNLLDKGTDKSKLILIPNWIDTSVVSPVEKSANRLYDEYKIDKEKFIILYAGNLGAAQGTDVIIDSAEILLENKDILFVVFGGGAKYQHTLNTIADKRLTNIIVNPLLPLDRISEVYSLGDISLIICKPGLEKSGMPSKTWSIMACNTPIIATVDEKSELSEIIRDSNAGFCVSPGDAKALACMILDMKKNLPDIEIKSRSYVKKHASKEQCVEKYISVFEEAVRCANRKPGK